MSYFSLCFFSKCRYSWRHQLREFKREYRVVALDLRGYGETDAPSCKENYKLDYIIVDVKEILDSLGKKNEMVQWFAEQSLYESVTIYRKLHLKEHQSSRAI